MRSPGRLLVLFTVLVAARAVSAVSGQSPARAGILPDAEIRQLLVDRIDTLHDSVGIVVGVIEPEGRRVVAYGKMGAADPRPVTGDTLYEIGSITKVFTALLLADAVQRGEVALTDPVAKFLPPTVSVPSRNGRVITLQDLASHRSGLPRLPGNMKPKDPSNPYADYTIEQLYAFLSSATLSRDIGAQYEYSNLGGGLLGHALARRAAMDYESLVRTRITGPLAMTSTAIALSADLKSRLATGHNQALHPVANWDLPTLAGAGALRSDASDLLQFLAAAVGYTPSPLQPAFAAMTRPRWPTGAPEREVALGWHIFTANGREIIWHNGGTAGYRTFIGYDPKARSGVVVLSNAGTPMGQDDLGRYLLDPSAPLRRATAKQ